MAAQRLRKPDAEQDRRDYPLLICRGWLARLRRDPAHLEAILARLEELDELPDTFTLREWGELVLLAEELKLFDPDDRKSRFPLPEKPSRVITQDAKLAILADRFDRRRQLWRPDDLRPDSPAVAETRAVVMPGDRKSRGSGDGFLAFECDPVEDDCDGEDDFSTLRLYDPRTTE